MLEWLFPKPPTLEERLRENRKLLNRQQRELARERRKIEMGEPQLKRRMKEAALKGNHVAAKMMAKQIITQRNACEKFRQMEARLETTVFNLQMIKSTAAMATAMKATLRAMMVMNRQTPLPQMQKIMQEFERQSEFMDLKQEIMDDGVDEMMAGDNDEEEEEALIGQIMEEVGIDLMEKVEPLKIKQKKEGLDSELTRRIQDLKK